MSMFSKSGSISKAVETILSILSFEQQFVVLKVFLQCEILQHDMVTIGVEQSLTKSALYKGFF